MEITKRNPFGEQALQAVERPLLEASTIPPEAYWSEEVFELEREEIWLKEWICVGRAEQIPDAGDYFTRTFVDEPIIVVRDGEGAIHAHVNVCRHRGCEIVGPDARFGESGVSEVNDFGIPYPAPPSGQVKTFRCPYHGWLYGLAGDLRATPDHKQSESFDRRDYSLVSLRVAVWNNFIFVNFDDDAAPFEDGVSDMSLWGIERYDLETMVQVATWERPVAANWKVCIENSIEAYHVPWVHLGVKDLMPLKGWKTFPDLSPQPWWMVVGQYPGMSYSDTGDAVFTPRAGLTEAMPEFDGLPIVVAFPGLLLALSVDTMTWRMTVPDGPGRSIGWQGLCIPADAAAALHAGDAEMAEKVRKLGEMMLDINDEDKAICEKVQRGLRSRKAVAGRFTKHEGLLHGFEHVLIDRAYGKRSRNGNGGGGNGSGNGHGPRA